MATPRRSFLQVLLAGLGGTVAGARVGSAQTPSHVPTTLDPYRRARAIGALRVINTLQCRHRHAAGGYLTLAELMRSEIAQRWFAELKRPPFKLLDVAATGQLLDGFVTQYHLAADRSGYTVFLREDTSAATFTSDDSGRIQEGITELTRSGFVTGSVGVLAEAFHGAPIVPREQRENPSLFSAIASFFVPTLHASGSSCCGTAGGHCVHQANCPACFPGVCCNLGYWECTFCCLFGQDSCEPVDEC